jgi:hypothetical protein
MVKCLPFVLTGLALLLPLPGEAQATTQTMEIEVIRTQNLNGCTIGTMGVNNSSLAASLELPWNDNQQNMSRIPAGTYSTILRYDHADAWRLELTGVPGHDHIQIHMGNWPSDSTGCILIGKVWNGGCKIEKSKEAYDALKLAFYGTATPNSTPDKTVTVTIQDPQ